MSDLISRADAIEAVAQQWLLEASAESPYVNDDDIGEYRKLAEELFEDVPSADADAYTRITGLMPDAEQGFRGGKIPPKEMLDGTVLIPQHQWLEMEKELAELKEEFESAEYEDYDHATLVDIKEPLKVLVVRCKDCKWWGGNKNTEHNNHICNRALNQDVDYWTKADDFCSYGERRKP